MNAGRGQKKRAKSEADSLAASAAPPILMPANRSRYRSWV
jgi:hypothetical protein